MKETNSLNLVKEFHETFKHPVLNTPEIPDQKRCFLRVTLLEEEVKEFKEAIEKKDIVAIADAFADIQYVLSGAILEFGLGDIFNDIFNEVHRSNMSKACSSEEEVNKTIDYNLRKDGVTNESYYSVKDGNKWLVYRKSDNKTIKSIDYSPADIVSIIKKINE